MNVSERYTVTNIDKPIYTNESVSVYRGHDQLLERNINIYFFHSEATDEKQRLIKYARERATEKQSHRPIIFDLISNESKVILITEPVEGDSVADQLAGDIEIDQMQKLAGMLSQVIIHLEHLENKINLADVYLDSSRGFLILHTNLTTPNQSSNAGKKHNIQPIQVTNAASASNFPNRDKKTTRVKLNDWENCYTGTGLPRQITWAGDDRPMNLVPAGPFVMGIDETNAYFVNAPWSAQRQIEYILSETPEQLQILAPYYLDVTPVTQGEYARFLEANPHHGVPAVPQSYQSVFGWDPKTRRPPKSLWHHPVVFVSWYDAQSYAQWAGKVLPSEAQWEKGARGSDGRLYPWGNYFDPNRLNSASQHASAALQNASDWDNWWQSIKTKKKVFTTPVYQYPKGASPYGLLDMAGNVWEWSNSWYDQYSGSRLKCDEYGETYRTIRGGSWQSTSNEIRTSHRGANLPTNRGYYLGFRCASPFLNL